MSSSNPPPSDDDWGSASTPWQPQQQPPPQQPWPQSPPKQPQQPPQQQWSAMPPAPPASVQSYLIPAIVVTLLCFLPTGIVAIIFAAQVSSKQQAGDLAGATKASNNAKTWVIVSVVTGLIFWALVLASG